MDESQVLEDDGDLGAEDDAPRPDDFDKSDDLGEGDIEDAERVKSVVPEWTGKISDIEGDRPILAEAEVMRERIRDQAVASLKRTLPVDANKYAIEVGDVWVDKSHYTHKQQKDAILNRRSLTEPVKAKMILRDKESGKVIQTTTRTVARLPWMTPRHTFMVEGTEYVLANQIRVKPGVYTRTKANGEPESAFNLGRGANFRLGLDQKRGHLFMQYGTAKIPAYPVLRAAGASHEDIEKALGKELAAVNRDAYKGKDMAVLRKAVQKSARLTAAEVSAMSQEELTTELRTRFERSVLDPDVTETTLGKRHTRVDADALLSASTKLIGVYNGTIEEDNRDSFAFKTLHTPDTFVGERIEKEAGRAYRMRVKSKLNRTMNPTIKDVVPPAPFSAPVRALLTNSALSTAPAQINPIEIIDGAGKVTSLGEGGISDMRSVPDSARYQQYSQFGVLDVVRTPESGGVGVDIRAAINASVDDKGNLRAQLINARTGKEESVPVSVYAKKNLALWPEAMKGTSVPVIGNDTITSVPRAKVDYILPTTQSMFSPTTNMVPGLSNMAGNRAIMGSKQVTQAVPLRDPDAPLVQTSMSDQVGGRSAEQTYAKWHLPRSPVDGTVTAVDEDDITVTDAAGKKHSVEMAKDFPMASKTRLQHTAKVKVGDKVKKAQVLAESNFTKDETFAIGKNLNTAYMAYRGLNSNDAVVISATAAKKLTSEHMYRETVQKFGDMNFDPQLHRQLYGTKYTPDDYKNLDSRGVAKSGAKIEPGQILIVAMRKRTAGTEDAMLGRLNKSLSKPWRDCSVTWDHGHSGEVRDVSVTDKTITVTVLTYEPMQVGDKISGRHGNKGVVSLILEDHEMPQMQNGEPLDLILTSAGIISRINPSQVHEAALSKVAIKTGKPVVIPTFFDGDRVAWTEAEMKKHGVSDKESVFDPATGRTIPGVTVGQPYIMKLFKSTDTNFSARGVGSTDVNGQPTKGGDDGAKSIGRMDFFALLAHGSNNILRESATVKSDQNDEYWRRVQLGMPTGPVKPSFAFQKFGSMLTGAGLNFEKKGSQFHLSPLTDVDVDKMATHTIETAGVVKAKSSKAGVNIIPETGGLFDPVRTGGLKGTRWSKIELAEPVVSPMFSGAAREILQLSPKDFNKLQYEEGGNAVKERLNAVDLTARKKELHHIISTKMDSDSPSSAQAVDRAVKQLKYIEALEKQGRKAGDSYVISKIAVVPPVMRPLVTGPDGKVMVSDPNILYGDLMQVNVAIKNKPKELADIEDPAERRKHLQAAVAAVYGIGDPVNPKTDARTVRGFMTQVVGYNSPKQGFYHEKLIKRRQQLSGRATIAPDPSLDLDELGVPEEMLWEQFKPFLVRRLVRAGRTPNEAIKMIDDRAPAARNELMAEIKQRPVLVNRAPTLHRYNIIAAYAVPVPGKTVRLNPFAEAGMNADYDGDAVQVHVPAEEAAVAEARKMTLSKLVFTDSSRDDLLVKPQHEAVIGLYRATSSRESGAPKHYATKQDAVDAYIKGDITMATPVTFDNQERYALAPLAHRKAMVPGMGAPPVNPVGRLEPGNVVLTYKPPETGQDPSFRQPGAPAPMAPGSHMVPVPRDMQVHRRPVAPLDQYDRKK